MTHQRPPYDPAFPAFAARHGLTDWEGWWSPYDEATYGAAQAAIQPDDVVLDIGAGDLRLALRLADQARAVIALEVNPVVLGKALTRIGYRLPSNLYIVCANALYVPWPPYITAAVLLMRHCQHFATYVSRLEAAGCRRLITNVRWGMGVEVIDFAAVQPWSAFQGGWYACLCGRVGFEGEATSADGMAEAVSVRECPACGLPATASE